MSNFNHYPDMDYDGDHDLKDSGMFHDMMDEEERNNYSSSAGCAPIFIIGILSVCSIFSFLVI